MKKLLTVCVVLGGFSLAYGEDCATEKLQLQNLIQENAQLQVNNAQLKFNAAQTEKTRLEALKKAAPTDGGQPAQPTEVAPQQEVQPIPPPQ